MAKSVLALLVSIAAAYAFSVGFDLLLGVWTGTYNAIAYLPMLVWSALAAGGFVFALRLRPSPLYVYAPCFLFAAVAFGGALVGPHRYSFVVALALAIEGLLLRHVLNARTYAQPNK